MQTCAIYAAWFVGAADASLPPASALAASLQLNQDNQDRTKRLPHMHVEYRCT